MGRWNFLLTEAKKNNKRIDCKWCSYLNKCNKKIKNTRKQKKCKNFKMIQSSAMMCDYGVNNAKL